jgi:hypothetical protein
VAESRERMEYLATSVKAALEDGDLAAYRELLDPAVTWGPAFAVTPPCRSRDDVLAWYERSRAAGASARVTAVSILDDRLLVGLLVTGRDQDQDLPDSHERWQVLTVRGGLVSGIVGFDSRAEADAYAAL